MVDYKVFYLVWASAVLAQCVDYNYTTIPPTDLLLTIAGISLAAGIFSNWLWRLFIFVIVWFSGVLGPLGLPLTYGTAFTLWAMIHTAPILSLPILGLRKPMPKTGSVFVTGCDSGMGFWTAAYLAKQGYHVFAGCYTLDISKTKLKEHVGNNTLFEEKVTCLPLDVTDSTNVMNAVRLVKAALDKSGSGLVGVINCAGLGYNGPAEYFPIDLYKQQMEVNYFGYVRVVQAFMPLLRQGCSREGRRGRVIMIGTGGGILSPAPPLLSAYMSSKWAVEAFAGCLRLELQLTNQPIDVSMLNPGFIKPTQLMEVGLALTEGMWEKCRQEWKHNQAEEEYGDLLNTFIEYSANEKGTHVSKVAEVMGQIMSEHRPNACYKVGEDSKAAPVVGLFPTYVREFIVKYSMYKQVGST